MRSRAAAASLRASRTPAATDHPSATAAPEPQPSPARHTARLGVTKAGGLWMALWRRRVPLLMWSPKPCGSTPCVISHSLPFIVLPAAVIWSLKAIQATTFLKSLAHRIFTPIPRSLSRQVSDGDILARPGDASRRDALPAPAALLTELLSLLLTGQSAAGLWGAVPPCLPQGSVHRACARISHRAAHTHTRVSVQWICSHSHEGVCTVHSLRGCRK